MSDLTPENIRKFLLGKLNDELVWQVIEQRLLSDVEFAAEIEICEDELIDDYLAGALTPSEIRAFEKHFLLSKEMRERLEFARTLKDSLAAENPQPRPLVEIKKEKKSFFNFLLPTFLPAPAFAALGLLFLGVVGFAAWQMLSSQSDLDKGLTALQRVYGDKRPFEARIVGFNHAPVQITRGAHDSAEDTVERDRVERLLLDAAAERKDTQTFYALGKFYLAEKNFDKALVQFEKAVRLSSNDARLYSDLGATLLETAKLAKADDNGGKSLELLGRSLEYSEKAIQLDAQMLEPRFNRALCLEEMYVFNTAKDAWREYLQLDSASLWTEEARRRLELLEQKNTSQKSGQELLDDFFAAFRRGDKAEAWRIQSRNKEMITGKLIPQQLAIFFLTAPAAEKAERLSVLQFSGALEAEKGDAYFADIAAFYAVLKPEQQAVLLEAQTKVNQGYELTLQYKIPEAHESFSAARKLFEQAGNHWEAALTDYWIGFLDYELVRVVQSEKRLLDLADYCTKNDYKWLCSQTYNWLAATAGVRGEQSVSLRYAEISLKLSQQIEDTYLTEKTLSWLADKAGRLGQFRKGFEYLSQSLALSSLPTAVPRQKSRDFEQAAQFFYFAGRYDEALVFALEWQHLSRQKPYNPSAERAANSFLGNALATRKRYDEAIKVIERSLEIASAEPKEEIRQKARSLVLRHLADVERMRGDCQKALGHYEEALQIISALDFKYEIHQAQKGRLLCSLETGNGTTEAINGIFALLEENRRQIRDEQTRNDFFNQEQMIYDFATDFEFKRGNYEESYNYAETSRSRSLLDLQQNGVKLKINQNEPEIIFDEKITQPLKLADLRLQISPEIQVVQYAVLPDKVLIWLVTRDKFETFSFPVKSEVLKEKIFDFLSAIKKNDDNLWMKALELNRILLEPIETQLDKSKTICFIPDKFLFHLPFAALRSGQSGKYLIEDYRILTAPSLNILSISSQNAARRGRDMQQEKLLSIGNPAFDKTEFRALSPLPAAENEARQITEYYLQNTVVLGADATKQKILSELPQADVIHFAGHYVANENSPLLSSFPVAGKKESGVLTNFEILQQNLARPRLIVLSACETEMEGYFDGEGIIGAGRTFLAAGVPLLVAAQWEVETESTAELMKRFHRLRKEQNLTTVAALQQAQKEMLAQPNENFRQPYYWAGFTALGGHAQF